MNVLSLDRCVRVVAALANGSSLRAAVRTAGVSRPTIASLLLRVGAGCEVMHDELVQKVPCTLLELDEVWAFVGKKQANVVAGDPEEYGDAYTFIGMDPVSKLVLAWRVDKRSTEATNAFVRDLHGRVVGRPQISTDGFKPYIEAIEAAFGSRVHYGQSLKTYAGMETPEPAVRLSRGRVISQTKRPIIGSPDPARINTSYVERQNLSLRMFDRRFTRLTNAWSKRLSALRASVALHFAHYNLVHVHSTLRMTPALYAGVTDRMWSVEELVRAALERAPREADDEGPPPMPSPPSGAPPAPVVPPAQAAAYEEDYRWLW